MWGIGLMKNKHPKFSNAPLYSHFYIFKKICLASPITFYIMSYIAWHIYNTGCEVQTCVMEDVNPSGV